MSRVCPFFGNFREVMFWGWFALRRVCGWQPRQAHPEFRVHVTDQPDIAEVEEWKALDRSFLTSCQEDVPIDTQNKQFHHQNEY